MKRKLLRGILALLITAELGLRIAGVTDFPTYDVDDGIGYVPSPGQSGNFLRTHDWVFNERSMGTARAWAPDTRIDVLLIGNSIVMGGNPYRQQDKLGPLLSLQLGQPFSVWPIAAGGWSNVNQGVYLDRHPEVIAGADAFVWEFMTGGFSGPSLWRGDYVFPRNRPWFATWYVARRYVLPKFIHFNMDEMPPNGDSQDQYVARFERTLKTVRSEGRTPGKERPGILFLYPNQAQTLEAKQGKAWLPERRLVERLAARHHLYIADLATYPQWQAALYRDGVHPTVEGNQVMARFLANAIQAHITLP